MSSLNVEVQCLSALLAVTRLTDSLKVYQAFSVAQSTPQSELIQAAATAIHSILGAVNIAVGVDDVNAVTVRNSAILDEVISKLTQVNTGIDAALLGSLTSAGLVTSAPVVIPAVAETPAYGARITAEAGRMVTVKFGDLYGKPFGHMEGAPRVVDMGTFTAANALAEFTEHNNKFGEVMTASNVMLVNASGVIARTFSFCQDGAVTVS